MVLLKISLLALLLALVECTQIKLSPPNDLHVDDRFGRCIKASSDLLIISKLPSRLAAYSNTIESDSAETFSQTGDLYIGTLYVYGISLDPSSATPLVIKTPDSNIFNNFGDVLDLTDDYLFVGASNDDTGGDRAGSVYVFRKNQDLTFSFLQKLLGAKAYQNFGMTLVAQDSTLVIGAPGDDEKGTDAGAVYIFNWDAETEVWRQKEKILPKTSVTEGFFPSLSRRATISHLLSLVLHSFFLSSVISCLSSSLNFPISCSSAISYLACNQAEGLAML